MKTFSNSAPFPAPFPQPPKVRNVCPQVKTLGQSHKIQDQIRTSTTVTVIEHCTKSIVKIIRKQLKWKRQAEEQNPIYLGMVQLFFLKKTREAAGKLL
jgi:hypothetical protein